MSSRKGAQSNLARVVTRFASVAARATRQPRLRGRDSDALMQHLLREIDETVLPRELTLVTETGALARLFVSNRRLISLDIEADASAGDAGPEPTDPESAARLYAKRLHGVLNSAGGLDIRLTKPAGKTDESGISCSAAHLAASAGLPLFDTGAGDRLESFARQIERAALAWLLASPGQAPDRFGGPAAKVAALRALDTRPSGGAAPAETALRIRGNQPSCMVLPLDTNAVVIATEDERQLIAVLPAAEVQAVMTGWHEIYRLGG